MLCQKCGEKQANVLYKQNINGKITEIAMCSDCAKAGSQSNIFNNPMTMNLFGDLFVKPERRIENLQHKVCTLCGSTLGDIAAKGKVGCAKCYEIFKNELSGTIERIHGKAQHNGRTPREYRAKNELMNKINGLKEELNKAVAAEAYEEAARIRDELKTLEGGSK